MRKMILRLMIIVSVTIFLSCAAESSTTAPIPEKALVSVTSNVSSKILIYSDASRKDKIAEILPKQRESFYTTKIPTATFYYTFLFEVDGASEVYFPYYDDTCLFILATSPEYASNQTISYPMKDINFSSCFIILENKDLNAIYLKNSNSVVTSENKLSLINSGKYGVYEIKKENFSDFKNFYVQKAIGGNNTNLNSLIDNLETGIIYTVSYKNEAISLSSQKSLGLFKYYVYHCKEKLNKNNDYTKYEIINDDTEIFFDIEGSYTKASPKNYEGFISKPIEQQIISINSSTKIYVYYDRISTTITFDANGGYFSASTKTQNSITGLYEATVSNIEIPSRDGYKFKKWDKDIPQTFGSVDETLIASWEPIKYTIVYNLNPDEINSPNNPTSYTIEDNAINLKPATKKGYTFNFWMDGTSPITTIPKGSFGNIVLTPSFTIENYSITYNLNGGTQIDDNPSSYTVETPQKILSAPVKSGYTFDGWYKEANFKTKVPRIPENFSENLTLYAKWLANNLSVSVKLPEEESDILPVTYTDEQGTFIFLAQEGYKKYTWYLDDVMVLESTDNLFSLNTNLSSISAGTHFLIIAATSNTNNLFSSQIQLIVTK